MGRQRGAVSWKSEVRVRSARAGRKKTRLGNSLSREKSSQGVAEFWFFHFRKFAPFLSWFAPALPRESQQLACLLRSSGTREEIGRERERRERCVFLFFSDWSLNATRRGGTAAGKKKKGSELIPVSASAGLACAFWMSIDYSADTADQSKESRQENKGIRCSEAC